MSYGLYWEPANPVSGKQLPTELKWTLAKRYFDTDGSVRADVILAKADCEYLRGLADGTHNADIRAGAEELIEAIGKHKEVRVWVGDSNG